MSKPKRKRQKLPVDSPARRQRIRPNPVITNRLQKAILTLIASNLTEQESDLSPDQQITAYYERIKKALDKKPAFIDDEKLPLDKQQEHLVDISLDPEILIVSQNVWDDLVREIATEPFRLKTIGRRTFEQLIAFLFEGFGYEVELTQQTRDGGRDIVALRKAELQTKYLIECKRPDPTNVVGIRPIRELYGVKSDEGASKAVLATTTHFSKDAELFAERHRWELELRDYNGILDWVSKYIKMTRK